MSYLWNTDKTGGVALTSKIVQKGVDNFKLMSAGSLDWDGVTMSNGTPLHSTDDLLDYIDSNSGTSYTDDDIRDAMTSYELRCPVSVCYQGESFSMSPAIEVWKRVGQEWTQLSWNDMIEEELSTTVSIPTSANNIFVWSSSARCLNGTANKGGVYRLNLVKNGDVVAYISIVVLLKALSSYHVTVYKSSQSAPDAPTGGSYNFTTKAFTAPTGWSTSLDGLSTPIWFSNGSVFSDGETNPTWSTPCMYFDHETLNIEHQSRNVAVYLTTSSDVIQANTPSGGTYDWSNDTWTVPKTSANASTYWSKTPAASIDAYLGSVDTSAEGYQGGKYITWVSYKYYKSDLTNGTRGNLSESAWSTPVKYIDIDAILDDAETRSKKIVSDAIEDAYSDL